MKLKILILAIFGLLYSHNAEAQFLKKLKEKAQQAAERTVLKKTDEVVSQKTDEAIDGVVNGKEKGEEGSSEKNKNAPAGTKYENPSLQKNTAAKKAWYTEDVKITYYDKEKQSETTSIFDADAVAMESHWTDQQSGKAQTAYIDSEGYFISYNDTEQRFTKTALLAMPGMNMMAPSMMASAYKLPEGAIFEVMEKMNKQGLATYPFMLGDFPFALNPEQFRNEMIADRYQESKQSCRGKMGCTKFSVLEAGYEGSYTLFDAEGRLVEINVEIKDDPFFGSGKGKINYSYEECTVNVPAAVEKKMPGQDLFKMGLDPTNKN